MIKKSFLPTVTMETDRNTWIENVIFRNNEKGGLLWLICCNIGTTGFILNDYFSLPELWKTFLPLRLITTVIGVFMLILLKKRLLPPILAVMVYSFSVDLFVSYGATLIISPAALTVWNTSMAFGLLLATVVFLDFGFLFSAIFAGLFIVPFFGWYAVSGQLGLGELMANGGTFLLLSAFTTVTAHVIKIRNTRHVASLEFSVYEKNQEIDQKNRFLEELATYDAMTQVFNRRTGLIILEDRMAICIRQASPLTIVYIDIDNLKSTNDGFGHEAGDRLIITVVSAIKSCLRKSDVMCRLGGDEFLLILSDCEAEMVQKTMMRIDEALMGKVADTGIAPEFSWGAIQYDSQKMDTLEYFVQAADQAMYLSKQAKKAKIQAKDRNPESEEVS